MNFVALKMLVAKYFSLIFAIAFASFLRIPLQFLRFEPYVIPKKSLTGDSTERVDTRVLQVIYRVAADSSSLFVGQQIDVYIEAPVVASALSQ